jgi:hypothetical protein
MAELLVKAKPHWMDSLTQEEVSKMSDAAKQNYESRSQIGDVVVVRPDGWQWGKEECLPNFIVVKVPQITFEEAKKYEEALVDNSNPEKPILLKHRKHQIPKVVVDNSILLNQSSMTVTKSNLDAQIIKKTK